MSLEVVLMECTHTKKCWRYADQWHNDWMGRCPTFSMHEPLPAISRHVKLWPISLHWLEGWPGKTHCSVVLCCVVLWLAISSSLCFPNLIQRAFSVPLCDASCFTLDAAARCDSCTLQNFPPDICCQVDRNARYMSKYPVLRHGSCIAQWAHWWI